MTCIEERAFNYLLGLIVGAVMMRWLGPRHKEAP